MINLKSPQEIEIMREGGKKLGQILKQLLQEVKPGITLVAIEQSADQLIKEAGGSASFKTVDDYRWATCLCVNEVVVHGIPTQYSLKDGDLLTIDIGMLYQGFHTDTAWSLEVGHPDHLEKVGAACKQKQRFLQVGQQALTSAIAAARPGNHIGHISSVIASTIEGAGYSVVHSLVGHGVGHKLHEEPQVPGILRTDLSKTPLLTPGMTLAIEVIYAQGKGNIVYDNDDGWTLATRDRSLASVFEQTIAITAARPIILTPLE